MIRVTFLTVMPSPYNQELFEHLANDGRFDLRVWYLEHEADDTYWGQSTLPSYAQVLPGRWHRILGARVHRNPGIQAKIVSSDSDIFVIVGYIGLTNQIAMRTLTRLGKPWVFWGELPGFKKRGIAGDLIRRALQSPIRNAKAVVGIGGKAAEAYRKLLIGMKSRCDHVPNIPYYTDLSAYTSLAEKQYNEKVRLFYCGQLIERKGVDLLVKAFVELLESGLPATLNLVGEGPLKQALKNMIPEKWKSCVNFTGFCQPKDLPRHFHNADVFVLPSRHDGWGVVVTQALAAGLPILSTTAVGAAVEYVTNRELGLLVPPSNLEELKKSIKDIVDLKLQGKLNKAACLSAATRFHSQCNSDAWYEVIRVASST